MAKLKMPYFSRGSYDALLKALESGMYQTLDRIVLHYVSEGAYQGQLILVDTEKNIYTIKGDSQAIYRVDELPTEESDINSNSFYLMDNEVYFYDEESKTFKTLYQDISETVNELSEQVENFSVQIDNFSRTVSNVSEDVVNLTETKADKGTTLDDYGIEDAYTKEETDDSISGAMEIEEV